MGDMCVCCGGIQGFIVGKLNACLCEFGENPPDEQVYKVKIREGLDSRTLTYVSSKTIHLH